MSILSKEIGHKCADYFHLPDFWRDCASHGTQSRRTRWSFLGRKEGNGVDKRSRGCKLRGGGMAIKEKEAKNDDTEELIGIFDKENTAEIW